MTADYYSDFVERAFIDPIRSVLIVDDDYPTFDEMLAGQVSELAGQPRAVGKDWQKQPARIQKVIQKFRGPGRPLLVDIHDGTNVTIGEDVKIAAHLHQSDLLVLDYQLDRTKEGDGSMAIEILRELMRNDHFNLVVMHTSEKLDQVFRSTLLALLRPIDFGLSAEEREQAKDLFAAAEDAGDDEALARLAAKLGQDQYLAARKYWPGYLRAVAKGDQPFSAFKAECDKLGWAVPQAKVVARYLLDRLQASLLPVLSSGGDEPLTWGEGATKFIYADKLFVAFSAKTDDDDVLAELLAALNAWGPPPSRLFLAKMRAEIDEYGVVAQSALMENSYALAHWYRRLLKSDAAVRRSLVVEDLNRHAEQLLAQIIPRVEGFATALVAAEATACKGDGDSWSHKHFGVNLKNESENVRAEREHNVFAGSKPPDGWHLTTGHVFTMGADYWVCVSPACDTVPKQLGKERVKAFGERLPFMAVRLNPMKDTKPITDVQTNRHVFLRLDGEVKTFCFNDPSDANSAPHWQMLLAGNRGIFRKGFEFRVFGSELKAGRLVQRRRNAKVVGQLRYEYALNLVQRLGASLTRIGLDFAP